MKVGALVAITAAVSLHYLPTMVTAVALLLIGGWAVIIGSRPDRDLRSLERNTRLRNHHRAPGGLR